VDVGSGDRACGSETLRGRIVEKFTLSKDMSLCIYLKGGRSSPVDDLALQCEYLLVN
jgi:hypothetical protein